MERDGVAEEEPRSAFENISGEVLVERARDVGEHEGDVGRRFAEDGKQSGEYMAGADSDTWDGAIGEHENGSGGVGVFLDLSLETFPLVLVLRKTASVGEPRRVDDTNLGKRLRTLVRLTMARTYHYAVLACKLINAS